ncbi:uncharacterized protein FSUBG_8139 [Fusarium subglutinans]|uniref:Uncharacterized protein n=1 Tax=Gibberella subglutinans TaxID=42677 RepID=A0A8H5PS12_GIBSU|nr:uncharacterized protein FSUBG_8139 [Fusarium subglutinans]KAF5601574.1 hypothetical protein FSUBG_8139 [Fusarium subglutinans]
MPREPPPWRGARTIIKGKKAALMSEEGIFIAKTVGNRYGGGYFDDNRQLKGEWITTSVLNRGTLIWDGDRFHHLDPLSRSMHAYQGTESYDASIPARLLVGYSAYTLEPVLARAAIKHHIYSNADDLAGLELEVPSEGTLSQSEVIFHHALTVPGNLRAVKHLLIGEDWRKAFADGDLTAEQAKCLAFQSAQSLHTGQTPIVVASIQPPTTMQVPHQISPSLEQCVDSGRLHGPKNRRYREILPSIAQHHYIDCKPATFLYRAPYVSNMRYPARLYSDLAAFAKAHPKDKFNATAMLFAIELWVTISECPTKRREPHAKEPVPEVSLPVFLVYFEHWLKIHEHLQCIAFAHPFRIIQLMYINDILTEGGSAFLIDESAIDSDRVRDLIYEAESIDPNIIVDERVDIFPFMVNGTKMVLPQDYSGTFRLSPTEQALLGMPDLRILSHPSLPTTDDVEIKIAIPEAIAQITFCKRTTSDFPYTNYFFDTTKDGPTSLFGSNLKCGTIWTHEFQMYTQPSDLPIEAYFKVNMFDRWSQILNRRMAWLETLGVLGKVRVRVGKDGLPGYHGMPSEDESRSIDDATMEKMAERALEDPRNRLIDEAKGYEGWCLESSGSSDDQ